jgi:hypothetical protein
MLAGAALVIEQKVSKPDIRISSSFRVYGSETRN